MYTQCPECLTIFSLDTAQLAQTQGRVGCGHCFATFDATATLADTLPSTPDDDLARHAVSPSPPVLMTAARAAPVQRAADAEADTEVDTCADARVAADADADAGQRIDASTDTPSFARGHGRRRPAHTLRWAAGCLGLTVLLAAQLAWAERDALIRNPVTRPALVDVCHALDCRLPAVADPSQLRLVSRDIRPHPSVPGALLISATVRNDAPFTQPYPVICVTLTDLDGQRVAMRRFRASQYIADARTRAAGLAPGTDAAVTFEVRDPGRDAVGFEFGFLRPRR